MGGGVEAVDGVDFGGDGEAEVGDVEVGFGEVEGESEVEREG